LQTNAYGALGAPEEEDIHPGDFWVIIQNSLPNAQQQVLSVWARMALGRSLSWIELKMRMRIWIWILVSVLSLTQMRNSWGFSQDYSVAACDIMDVITFLFFLAKRQESKARNSFGPPEMNLPWCVTIENDDLKFNGIKSEPFSPWFSGMMVSLK